MKTALLSKVALCVCPPVMLATTVTTVPPVRKAVHALTRPHHSPRHHAPARLASARPAAVSAPCAQAGGAPPATLLTLADLGPEDVSAIPAGLDDLGSGAGGPGGGPGYISSATSSPPVLAGPAISAVPEPMTWLLLMAGLGSIGTMLRLRSRRRYRVKTDSAGIVLVPTMQRRGSGPAAMASAATGMGALWSGLAAVRASSKPVTATGQVAAAGGKAVSSAALAKLAMCLCPPAAMIAGTAAIPTVRQAVYSATAPKPVSTALPAGSMAPPCDPAVPASIGTVTAPLSPVVPLAVGSPLPETETGADAATTLSPSASLTPIVGSHPKRT